MKLLKLRVNCYLIKVKLEFSYTSDTIAKLDETGKLQAMTVFLCV